MAANIEKDKTDKVRGLLGIKIGMTTFIHPEGEACPVTVIKAGPCEVIQVKTQEKDGYSAAQVGYREKKRLNKPLAGHHKKNNVKRLYHTLKEFEVADDGVEPGQFVTVDIFEEGEKIDVSGTSKGRGFAGVVKRFGFGGGHKTHGGNVWRLPGSSGCGTYPGKVIKGKEYPGRYGNKRISIQNLEIVKVLPEENAILVKGSVPGPINGILQIRKAIKG